MSRKDEITERMCALASLVGSDIFKHRKAHDCFCHYWDERNTGMRFQFDEPVIRWIEKIVAREVAKRTKTDAAEILHSLDNMRIKQTE